MRLDIVDLHVSADDKEIIRGVSLSIKSGEFHVLMGPNGSGKSTLSMAVMGYPEFKITGGDILVDGNSIVKLPANERARLGLFMQFQDPAEIEGVGLVSFLTSAKSAIYDSKINVREFMNELKDNAKKLHMQEEVIGRPLNFGFSGGEKKKSEILQMLTLKPKIALLDEPDSGLDVDAVKDVANAIDSFGKETGAGMLLITHYVRILKYLAPQFVHVLVDGKLVKSGGPELADYIDKNGYKF
ncbi:MAG: Fe-S cluster assembly ATPase SufC [Candidatus Micrarchaeia archaeon]